MSLDARDREGGVRLTVHAKPRASRSAIVGVVEGRLEVALAAPPVDGGANAELQSLLARVFGCRRKDVAIVAGASSRTKIVEICGVTADAARATVQGLLAKDGRRELAASDG